MLKTKIEDFLNLYQSKNTKHSYGWAIGEYFKIIYGDNYGEKEYFNEKHDVEADLKAYVQKFSDKPPLTVRLMISAVKSFLIENDVDLPLKFWRSLNRKVRGTRAATMDAPPSKDQLRRIITHMPIQGKALFLSLTSSGMRIGESLQLMMEDIELDKDPAKVNLRREYTKSGNARITFISGEAKEAIQEWLKVRDDYLVAAVKKCKVRPRYKRKFKGKSLDDDRLFPFDVPTAYYIWTNALKKSGFQKRDNGTKRMIFHPHVLRKFFRSQMAQLIEVDVVEALMGHEGYLTEVYRKYTPQQLAEFYVKGEPSVRIFGSATDAAALKESLKGVNRAIKTVSEDLENKIKVKDAEIKQLNVELEKVEKEVKLLNDSVEYHMKNFERASLVGEALLKYFPDVLLKARDKIVEERQEKILKADREPED